MNLKNCLCKAKKISNNKWVTGFLVWIDDKYYIYTGDVLHFPTYSIPECVEINKHTICRCTGITDNNSSLIWENDIIEFLGEEYEVVFEAGAFGIVTDDSEPLDYDKIKETTNTDRKLDCCFNDYFISLWELLDNFDCEGNCLNVVKVKRNLYD